MTHYTPTAPQNLRTRTKKKAPGDEKSTYMHSSFACLYYIKADACVREDRRMREGLRIKKRGLLFTVITFPLYPARVSLAAETRDSAAFVPLSFCLSRALRPIRTRISLVVGYPRALGKENCCATCVSAGFAYSSLCY